MLHYYFYFVIIYVIVKKLIWFRIKYNADSFIMLFSNRDCNQIFNASIKDARMCLNSLQFTSMAVSKSLFRRYSWKLQKLLFGFSVAAAFVWHSGTISSLLSESYSKILFAVLKISSQWKASLLSLFKRRRSSLKLNWISTNRWRFGCQTSFL